jgi:phosphoribosylformylglycinamidine synthase I
VSRRVAVVVFPGSNCEFDVAEALGRAGADTELVWHTEESLAGYDAVVLPGGFAHGDYLRPGALARFSPIMGAVERFAAEGGPLLGICNGFQILTEARLLPGALRRNDGLRFLCREVVCEVVSSTSALTRTRPPREQLRLPINHFEGNYTCDEATLAKLEDHGQIVLRYVTNPNGSAGSVAAVANETGNVVGCMPHPERASDPLLGNTDGAVLLEAFLNYGDSAGRRRQAATTQPLTPARTL